MLSYGLTILLMAIIAGLLGFGVALSTASLCAALCVVSCIASSFRVERK